MGARFQKGTYLYTQIFSSKIICFMNVDKTIGHHADHKKVGRWLTKGEANLRE